MVVIFQNQLEAGGFEHISVEEIGANKISEKYPERSFDLIYCHSVIQYFEDDNYFKQFFNSSLNLLNLKVLFFSRLF